MASLLSLCLFSFVSAANAYGSTAYGEQFFFYSQYDGIENYTYKMVGWCILGASVGLLIWQLSPITTLLLVRSCSILNCTSPIC